MYNLKEEEKEKTMKTITATITTKITTTIATTITTKTTTITTITTTKITITTTITITITEIITTIIKTTKWTITTTITTTIETTKTTTTTTITTKTTTTITIREPKKVNSQHKQRNKGTWVVGSSTNRPLNLQVPETMETVCFRYLGNMFMYIPTCVSMCQHVYEHIRYMGIGERGERLWLYIYIHMYIYIYRTFFQRYIYLENDKTNNKK